TSNPYAGPPGVGAPRGPSLQFTSASPTVMGLRQIPELPSPANPPSDRVPAVVALLRDDRRGIPYPQVDQLLVSIGDVPVVLWRVPLPPWSSSPGEWPRIDEPAGEEGPGLIGNLRPLPHRIGGDSKPHCPGEATVDVGPHALGEVELHRGNPPWVGSVHEANSEIGQESITGSAQIQLHNSIRQHQLVYPL